ncbi:MAG: LPS export ABC transporter periplasmic protein LptC [Oscillatoriales cyanobacterium RM1_1_9]|nr:LPS export ABC transporter periplasmic protein LptC [Oscillatoriales cyanobacterium SM2_3_0]NJO47593.1 LPS export ABC transporter periplasmic protein LptC [Oscillatoriales cyanobacterium RM2_1_1]NJO71640.1 LPS export ABC transporter periplasmic protein LptC [Oscillatoriales cyanobacterium RM1_1_9]
MLSNHQRRTFSLVGSRQVTVLILILIISGGCRQPGTSSDPQPTNPSSEASEEEFSSDLTLDEVTLEQANEAGELIWKINSKQVRYSPDQKVAKIVKPEGEMFQDGKLIYRMKAESGEIHQDSKRIFLKDNITATDLRNGIVLKGKELEWLIDQEILVVRQGVTGDHQQAQAIATEAQVFTRDKRVEFWNQVVVTSKDPVVQMRTDHVIWNLEPETLISDRKITLDRYQDQTITDRGVAETAELNLKTSIATLNQKAQLALSEPPLQIGSDEISWNYQQQTLSSPKPTTIIHRDEKVTLTANQAQGDLNAPTFTLRGNVVSVGEKRQSQLNTDELIWFVNRQQFQARGNVIYRQLDPPFTLTGSQAVGELKDETISVSSGQTGDRVVTEFVP